jgi:hypothetical protein
MDDIQKLQNHLKAIEHELNELWTLHGMQPPKRIDSGGAKVTATRDDAGRRVFDKGAQ